MNCIQTIEVFFMKTLGWTIAGICSGLAACIVLTRLLPRQSMGSDDIENTAKETFHWGSKQRLSGAGRRFVGEVKENVGKIIGDQDLTGEGVADQATGAAKDVAGNLAHAVGQTIHELNR
jgi:uncharacterized protein YjbJ (UPF0337 family)